MADGTGGFEYFAVNEGGEGLGVLPSNGEYDPGISTEINAAIRNMPQVKKYCDDMAKLLSVRAAAGLSGEARKFEVIKAGGKSRYRAYVAPQSNEAIEAELNDGVLLKAALSMQGK